MNLTDVTISGATTGYYDDYFASGTLTGNTFTHNQTSVYINDFASVTATNNLFEYSGPNEFYVTQPEPGGRSPNLLVSNKFYKNKGDGLDIMMPGSSLKSNQAIDNTGHGMVVVAGTKNLGGNIAYGNTKNPQCIGLVCHP